MEGGCCWQIFHLKHNGDTCVFFYHSSDTEDEKAYKNWKKSIMLVWRSAANHKSVWMTSGTYALCQTVSFYEYRFGNTCLCIKIKWYVLFLEKSICKNHHVCILLTINWLCEKINCENLLSYETKFYLPKKKCVSYCYESHQFSNS